MAAESGGADPFARAELRQLTLRDGEVRFTLGTPAVEVVLRK